MKKENMKKDDPGRQKSRLLEVYMIWRMKRYQ